MNSISSISATASRFQARADIAWPQRANDIEALESALQSGNIWAARQAFAALVQKQQNTSHAPGASGASSQNSPASTAFQTLQGALNSGNLSAAQLAFATLQLGGSS
jgi:hypothetical protein